MSDWMKFCENEIDNASQYLLSQQMMSMCLERITSHMNSPIMNCQLEFTDPDNHAFITCGSTGEGKADHVDTFHYEQNREYKCRISLWINRHIANESVNDIQNIFKQTAEAFLKPSLRDKTKLYFLQNPQTQNMVNNTISKLTANDEKMALLFCDLDKFKRINDQINQQTGDRVILEFGEIFLNVFREFAIPMHRSGDEFTALVSVKDPFEALYFARKLMRKTNVHKFNVGDIPVSASVGIAIVMSDSVPPTYGELEPVAEHAMKPENTHEKQRGKARLNIYNMGENVPTSVNRRIYGNVALCLIRTQAAMYAPFMSPWLNLISYVVCEHLRKQSEAGFENLKQLVLDMLSWISPDPESEELNSLINVEKVSVVEPRVSAWEIAMAIAHGIFRAGLNGVKIPWMIIKINDSDLKSAQLSNKDGQELFCVGLIDKTTETIDLGMPLSTDDSIVAPWSHSILLKIGHHADGIVEQLIPDVVTVDDRPTRGGGLPDFWEATIADVIARVATCNGIGAIYVIGNLEYAKETTTQLRTLSEWPSRLEPLAYKTGSSQRDIVEAVKRLDGKVFFPNGDFELTEILARELRSRDHYEYTPHGTRLTYTRRFLRRTVNLEGMSLGQTGGCRVKTAAEAFPIVLETVRNVNENYSISDQAGRELNELIDFRVHLLNPSNDPIPDYYREDKDSLNRYYEQQFLKEDGLFGACFVKNNQKECVLRHVVSALIDDKHTFATRRAVLIIPHETNLDKDLSPLGLISVRIIPRFKGKHVMLSYSFTWRTVEALVGFPYSIYGSVRFAEHLTNEIKDRTQEYDMVVEMGELSYIAHSLHIFADEYGQGIARRIVDDCIE